MVTSCSFTNWLRMLCWATDPTKSKSLLFIFPSGLDVVTSCLVTLMGNGARHKYGWMVPFFFGTKYTPPIYLPEASSAPRVAGNAAGMTLSMLVGLFAIPSSNQRKSSKNACTWRPNCTWVPSFTLWRKDSCNEQNIPRAPGTTSAIKRSWPMTCCHFLVETGAGWWGCPPKWCAAVPLYGVETGWS
jgi:hypothetical protein